jgi:hypothetical protein
MKLAFLCESPDVNTFDGPRIDWVVVNLSPRRVAQIKQLVALANEIGQKDPTLSELQFKMNEVTVCDYFPVESKRNEFHDAYDQASAKGWMPLVGGLDLDRYSPLELKSKQFCVRPAKGKRPASFSWLIHIKDVIGPGRTIEWRVADLEKALGHEAPKRSCGVLWEPDIDFLYGSERKEVLTGE